MITTQEISRKELINFLKDEQLNMGETYTPDMEDVIQYELNAETYLDDNYDFVVEQYTAKN